VTRIKVMHVITRLDYGGSAQNTLLTALGHTRSRFEPVVVTGTAGRADAQGGQAATDANRSRLVQAGIRCVLVPSLQRPLRPFADLWALGALLRLMRAESPSIVHAHTSKAGILARLAAWMARVPVVVHTPHGHVFYGHFSRPASWLFLQLERLWARGTARMIALTEAERDEHLERHVGAPEHFRVIPSGIDLEPFWNVADGVGPRPQGFQCPVGTRIVGSVGWLTAVKGHRVLIEAVARLKPAHPELQVMILGSGPLQDELMTLGARLGMGPSIHLLGMRRDVPACLAAMDLFVLPSLNEGMGRALVEAMAAGRPVIASRVGGVPAIVHNRQNGLLVPPGDPAALANAIEELLRRPDWARELGAAGRKTIDLRFGAREMVRAVEAVYDEALAERGLA
jgi:glycosyltransferase involved in cell wall biosynthesis